MKPVIINIEEMSESRELYQAKPQKLLVWTIYIIFFILLIAFLWMKYFKIDIVVKSNGVFQSEENTYEIGNQVNGTTNEIYVRNGEYVKSGMVLFVLSNDSVNEFIDTYQNKEEELRKRIEILNAYQNVLEGNEGALDKMKNNPYYSEILNRKNLLEITINNNSGKALKQENTYTSNISSLKTSIEEYRSKYDKFETAKRCIYSRTNEFTSDDSYFDSLVNSYLSSYRLMSGQYDSQINEYQGKAEEYEKELEKLEKAGKKKDKSDEKKTLEEARDGAAEKVESLKLEKEQALSNLELQQVAEIEQMQENLKSTILSAELNVTSEQIQLDELKENDISAITMSYMLSEKAQIYTELFSLQSELEECQCNLKNYRMQEEKCTIYASASGYFYYSADIQEGTYIQEGTKIGTIYPEGKDTFFAEVYVDNSQIGKLYEGQRAKIEIEAYPSNEYGYFIGEIESIPKNIAGESGSGTYYAVKVKCNLNQDSNDTGKIKDINIIEGMFCKADFIVEEKNVLAYVLEKLDFVKE